MKKAVFSAMSRSQRVITGIVFASVVLSVLVALFLTRELVSGRLNHIENPNFRGEQVLTEVPSRLVGIDAGDVFIIRPQSDADIELGGCRLSLGADDLAEWFAQTQLSPDQPLELVLNLSCRPTTVGLNLFSQRFESFSGPDYSGDFYLSLTRPVVEEIQDVIAETGNRFSFYVVPTPLQFDTAELALRNELRLLNQKYGFSPEQCIVAFCAILLILLGALPFLFWKRCVYLPVFRDLILFRPNGIFGSW